MKKLLTLMVLLVMGITGAWAQDPTWSINTSSAASSAWAGSYYDNAITVTFSSGSSGTKYENGGYVLGNNPSSGWSNNCLEVTSTSVIEKITFLVSSNDGKGASIQPAVLAWTGAASIDVDVAWSNDATASIKNTYTDAVEQTYTFTGKSYKRVRIYRKASPKVGGSGSATNVGSGTTCKIWGVKVWLKSSGPAISSFNPVSGKNVKTGAEITINGTSGSTIYYAWATSAQTADAIYNSGSGNHGTTDAGTATTTVEEGKTLYAIARKDNTNSAVASATYTIDDTAPTLSSSTPANSETGVVLSGNIVLTFSENVSINDASKFTLTGGAGTLNTASATVSGAAVTIPYSGLDMNTEYTLSTAAGAVQDAAGNTNVALSDITFTTLNDVTPPTLSDSNPADGATGITSAVNVTLTFSENVVLSGDFTLTPSGATVGTPIVSDATITIPIKGMSYGTAYTLGLAKEGLADEAGNNLAADIALGFTTMTAPATTKTWNFKEALNSNDKLNFDADNTNWTDDYNDSSNKRYKSKGTMTSEVLMANGKPIEKTAGILFTATGDDQIRLGDANLMIKSQSPITIPNLKANDEVTIVFSSGNGSATRTISVSNASLVYGTNSSPNYDEVTAVYKVSADGNVTIIPSDWMRFYGITVATNSNNAVTVSSAAYATIVTTGNVDFSKTPGVTAYKATISGTSLVLSEVTAAPENTPLIIAADAASYVLAITTSTPSAVKDNDLKAASVDITQADATSGKTIYVLNKVGDVVCFYKLSATGTLKAGKAYVELDSTSGANALNFFINDEQETDGIKAVNESEFKFKEGIYDMQGCKVVRPTKGLYIVNGKKVVIK